MHHLQWFKWAILACVVAPALWWDVRQAKGESVCECLGERGPSQRYIAVSFPIYLFLYVWVGKILQEFVIYDGPSSQDWKTLWFLVSIAASHCLISIYLWRLFYFFDARRFQEDPELFKAKNKKHLHQRA